MEFGLMEFAKLQSLTPSPPGPFLITTDAARDYRRASLQYLLRRWGSQVCLVLSTSWGEC